MKIESSKYFYRFKEMLQSCLTETDAPIKNELLDCFQIPQADILVEKLEEKWREYGNLYNFLSLIETFLQKKYWQERYLTGAILNQLQTTEFKVKLIKVFDSELLISWDDYYHFIFPLKERFKEKQESVDSIFSEILSTFATHLQQKYPNSSIAILLRLTQSSLVNAKIEAYRALQILLEEITSLGGDTHQVDESLEKLITLTMKSGLDAQTCELIITSLRSYPELLASYVVLLVEGIRFPWPDALRVRLETEAAQCKLSKPLELLFPVIAKHHIAKFSNNLSGNMLSEIVKAHGEKILPTIETYGLTSKLVNGQQLTKILDKTRKRNIRFENRAIDEQQLCCALINKFQDLVCALIVDPIECTNPQKILVFYAELLATTKTLRSEHQPLLMLIDTYPTQKTGNLLMWLTALACCGDAFAQDHLKTCLLKDDYEPYLMSNVFAVVLKLIQEGKLTNVTTLEAYFTSSILRKFVTHYINQLSSAAAIAPFILNYLSKSLQQRQLTYKDLGQVFIINIQEEILTHLFTTAQRLIPTLTLVDLQIYFDNVGQQHPDPILQWILSKCEEGIMPSVLKDTLLRQLETGELSLDDLEKHYSIIHKNKFIAYVVQSFSQRNPSFRWPNNFEEHPAVILLLKKKLSFATFSQLTETDIKRIEQLASYFTADVSSVQIDKNSPLFTLDSDKAILFPLIDQKIIEKKDVEQLKLTSSAYQSYAHKIRTLTWQDGEACTQLIRLKEGLENADYLFIQTHLEEYLLRRANEPSVDDTTKNQLEEVSAQLQRSIQNTLVEIAENDNAAYALSKLIKELYCQLHKFATSEILVNMPCTDNLKLIFSDLFLVLSQQQQQALDKTLNNPIAENKKQLLLQYEKLIKLTQKNISAFAELAKHLEQTVLVAKKSLIHINKDTKKESNNVFRMHAKYQHALKNIEAQLGDEKNLASLLSPCTPLITNLTFFTHYVNAALSDENQHSSARIAYCLHFMRQMAIVFEPSKPKSQPSVELLNCLYELKGMLLAEVHDEQRKSYFRMLFNCAMTSRLAQHVEREIQKLENMLRATHRAAPDKAINIDDDPVVLEKRRKLVKLDQAYGSAWKRFKTTLSYWRGTTQELGKEENEFIELNHGALQSFGVRVN